MKCIINSLILSLFVLAINAQLATELDFNSVMLTSSSKFLAITTAIPTASHGIRHFNIRTSSYYDYTETAWSNIATTFALPCLQNQKTLLPLKVKIEARLSHLIIKLVHQTIIFHSQTKIL